MPRWVADLIQRVANFHRQIIARLNEHWISKQFTQALLRRPSGALPKLVSFVEHACVVWVRGKCIFEAASGHDADPDGR